MQRTRKRMLKIILLFVVILLLGGVKSFAATNNEKKAFNEFKNLSNESKLNLYVGEEVSVLSSHSSLQGKVTYNSNPDIVEAGSCYIKAKKAGTAKVTMEVTLDGKTESRTFNVSVGKTNVNTALDSNMNDVVSITPVGNSKCRILFANGDLWITSKNATKLSKKECGNVQKYVYTRIYDETYVDRLVIPEEYLYTSWAGEQKYEHAEYTDLTATLKKDGTLILNYNKQSKIIKNVVDITDLGYLDTKGRYYIYVTDKDGNFKLKKEMTGVKSLINEYWAIKNNSTYDLEKKKIFGFEVAEINYGLALDQKGTVYHYEYDYEKQKYIVKKIEKNVEKLVGDSSYKTKSGKIKQYDNDIYNYDPEEVDSELISKNHIVLKENGKLYINYSEYSNNGERSEKYSKILDKVENINRIVTFEEVYFADWENSANNIALITRKDGSIWRLELGGKAQLSRIRDGKIDNKKVAEPTNVKVVKSGDNNAKIKWSNVDGAKKYTIYRATSENGNYTKIGTSSKNTYTDKGIKLGKVYYYKVVANHENSKYNSKKSSAVQIKIPKTPTKLVATQKSKTSLKVSYNNVSGATGYEIQYSTSKDFGKSKTKNVKNTSATITGLTKNKTYYVKVRAYITISGKKVYSSYSGTKTIKLK